MVELDITNCDAEPIHLPGKIQQHGFLIALDKKYTSIGCSKNVSDFLPIQDIDLLGKPIGDFDHLFPMAGGITLSAIITTSNFDSDGLIAANPYPITIGDESFNLIISCFKETVFLEFEPDAPAPTPNIQVGLNNTLAKMLGEPDLGRLLSLAANMIKDTIGFERVMIYKFHVDGHGEVVAEAKAADLAPFLGLHYPASDIPKQARELYKINLTRLIADVDAAPAALLCLPDRNGQPLDLTFSVLRAVSPIHIQYLKNMGVASSFSISLLHEGELWGLVACHHYTPKFINFTSRESAKFIGQLLSSALTFCQDKIDEQTVDRHRDVIEALTKQMLHMDEIEDALFRQDTTILDVVKADGASLSFGGKIYSTGNGPDESFVSAIVEWLDQTMVDVLFETDQLPALFPAALPYKDQASGLLACRLSKELKEYLLWFRVEVPAVIHWAGDPEKPVEIGGDGLPHISPRRSFQKWAQTVKNKSAPWGNEDVKAALHFREEMIFVINRKAFELRAMNEKLKAAYDELDAFSHTLSHDLRTPLTAIKGFTQILQLDAAVGPMAQGILARIAQSVKKMQLMITTILDYSRQGGSKNTFETVKMREILIEVREELVASEFGAMGAIIIKDTPDVYGERTMLMQVFSNLLGNAVKYSKNAIDPMVSVTGVDLGDQVKYTVSDNGIGIKNIDMERVFDLFARSDEVNSYEGSGVGLAIVKRIVDKHNGRIWIESDPDAGTHFNVLFAKNPKQRT